MSLSLRSRFAWDRLRRRYQPEAVKKRWITTRRQWRMWWKYDSGPTLEYWGLTFLMAVVGSVFVGLSLFVRIPSEDPNKLLQDPFFEMLRYKKQGEAAEKFMQEAPKA